MEPLFPKKSKSDKKLQATLHFTETDFADKVEINLGDYFLQEEDGKLYAIKREINKPREIKFKAISKTDRKWVYGDLIHNNGIQYIRLDNAEEVEIFQETVCEFTGVQDKNGVDIYEHDLILTYGIGTSCVNPDCDAFNHIFETYLKKTEEEVEFSFGGFVADGIPIGCVGFDSLEEVRDCINILDDENTDCNGTEITEDVLGIVFNGNVYDSYLK